MKLCRLKISLIISFVFLSALTFGQITIEGRVIDKRDGCELTGVNILEKGTKNGTITDTKGYFKIEVADSNSILVISFIGYITQEIQINDSKSDLIKLKVDCHFDFFDYNDICLGFSSGVLNTPYGVFGYINFPFLNLSTLQGGIEYQTDFSPNKMVNIRIGTLHLLAMCDYTGDIYLNYRSIDKNDFTFNNLNIEGKLNFTRPRIFPYYSTLFFGYGLADFSNLTEEYDTNSGILVGFGTLVGKKPIYININVKAIYWIDFWEYIGEIKWQYKNVMISADYNLINTYQEINLRFGYIINY